MALQKSYCRKDIARADTHVNSLLPSSGLLQFCDNNQSTCDNRRDDFPVRVDGLGGSVTVAYTHDQFCGVLRYT